jgi:hypothetical protein
MYGGSCNSCSSCSPGVGVPLVMEHPAWVSAWLDRGKWMCLPEAWVGCKFHNQNKYKTAVFTDKWLHGIGFSKHRYLCSCSHYSLLMNLEDYHCHHKSQSQNHMLSL